MVFYITDERMDNHFIPWNSTHIEIPERLQAIREELKTSGVLHHCDILSSRMATKEEILSVHTPEYYGKIEESKGMGLEELEKRSSEFEDIYLNKDSFDLSLLSAGSALELTKKVYETKSSGFAAIRPPGHHAFPNSGCGFCIFNNVVICAKQALKWGAKRVLIVDWDVHAGQGTQECIEGDDRIRSISIHRFQNGTFWPNLEQCAVKNEFKNTVNVPLNATGMGDSEYLSIMELLILPMVNDFKPDLILVSCGFDASIGDPEGEMCISPSGYGTMTRLLLSTGCPLSLILEGGYFLQAIAQSAVECVTALQGKEYHMEMQRLKPEFLETFLRVLQSAQNKYPSVKQIYEVVRYMREEVGQNMPKELPEYQATRNCPIPFPTRDVYTIRPESENERYRGILKKAMEEAEERKGPRKTFTLENSPNYAIEVDMSGGVIRAHSDFHPFLQYAVISALSGVSPPSTLSPPPSDNLYLSEFAVSLSKLTTIPFFRLFPFVQLAYTSL